MFIAPVESFGPALMSLVIIQTEKQDKLPSIETILPKQNSSDFSEKKKKHILTQKHKAYQPLNLSPRTLSRPAGVVNKCLVDKWHFVYRD